MLIGILKQLNWVDYFVIILLIRISYNGIKQGLPTEFFKTLGIIVAIFFSLHFYTGWGKFLNQHSILSSKVADFLAFIALIILINIAFFFIRVVFFRLIKVEAMGFLDKWGGGILGFIRGILVASLIILILNLSTIKYLGKSTKDSLSGGSLSVLAPKIYSLIFDNILIKFSPQAQPNEAIYEVLNNIKL